MLDSMKNCVKCKKAFLSADSILCDECIKEEKEMYEKVREHLKEHPGLSLLQLAKETEVSAKKISKYIKEGRLELAQAELECEKCGIKLKTGRFCENCIDSLAKKTLLMVNEYRDASKKGSGMHSGINNKR